MLSLYTRALPRAASAVCAQPASHVAMQCVAVAPVASVRTMSAAAAAAQPASMPRAKRRQRTKRGANAASTSAAATLASKAAPPALKAAAPAAAAAASGDRAARLSRQMEAFFPVLKPKDSGENTGPRLLQRQRARTHWAGATGVGLAKAPAPVHHQIATHGKGQIMNRSFRGIFAGVHVHFGNMVSHSTRRTRRTWLPNVHRMRLDSQVLGRSLYLPVSMRALRTFDKYGGIDRYLLRQQLHRLDHGITRELRTAMELTLLNNPEIATELNLQDVLQRVQSRKETARLRALEAERALLVARSEEPGASPLPKLFLLARVRDSAEEVAKREALEAAQHRAKVIERQAQADWFAPPSALAARDAAIAGEPAPIAPEGSVIQPLSERDLARVRSRLPRDESELSIAARIATRKPSYEFPFYKLKAWNEPGSLEEAMEEAEIAEEESYWAGDVQEEEAAEEEAGKRAQAYAEAQSEDVGPVEELIDAEGNLVQSVYEARIAQEEAALDSGAKDLPVPEVPAAVKHLEVVHERIENEDIEQLAEGVARAQRVKTLIKELDQVKSEDK